MGCQGWRFEAMTMAIPSSISPWMEAFSPLVFALNTIASKASYIGLGRRTDSATTGTGDGAMASLLNESTGNAPVGDALSPIEVHSNFSDFGSLENTGLALIAEIEGTDDCVLVESMSALAFSPMFRQVVAECGRNGGQIPTVGADEKCFDKSFEFLQLCARLFRGQ